jgi:hypothetical protein
MRRGKKPLGFHEWPWIDQRPASNTANLMPARARPPERRCHEGHYVSRVHTSVRVTGVPSRSVVLNWIVSVFPEIANRLTMLGRHKDVHRYRGVCDSGSFRQGGHFNPHVPADVV